MMINITYYYLLLCRGELEELLYIVQQDLRKDLDVRKICCLEEIKKSLEKGKMTKTAYKNLERLEKL